MISFCVHMQHTIILCYSENVMVWLLWRPSWTGRCCRCLEGRARSSGKFSSPGVIALKPAAILPLALVWFGYIWFLCCTINQPPSTFSTQSCITDYNAVACIHVLALVCSLFWLFDKPLQLSFCPLRFSFWVVTLRHPKIIPGSNIISIMRYCFLWLLSQ